MKIYKFIDNFEESNEFNLYEYSSQIENFFDENVKKSVEIKENDENHNINNSDSDNDNNNNSDSDNDNNNNDNSIKRIFKFLEFKRDKIYNIKEPQEENPFIVNKLNVKMDEKKKEVEDEKEKKNKPNIAKDEQNEAKDKKEIIEYFDFSNINFDMNYHIGNNGNIVLIIGINLFNKNKRLITLLEIDLNKIQFH